MEDDQEELWEVGRKDEYGSAADGPGEFGMLVRNACIERKAGQSADDQGGGVDDMGGEVEDFGHVDRGIVQNVLDIHEVPPRAQMDEDEAERNEGRVWRLPRG